MGRMALGPFPRGAIVTPARANAYTIVAFILLIIAVVGGRF